MKKLLLLTALSLFVLALLVGCGNKTDEAQDKVPVETKQAEMMDSTRMDSGMEVMDSTIIDSMEQIKDSL